MSEEQTSYYAKYYAKNKEKLIAKQSTKQKCIHCDRMVTYNFMKKHTQSKICKNHAIEKARQMDTKDIEYIREILRLVKETPAN